MKFKFKLGNQYSRKYNLNFNFFKKWSPVMSYLLGYLFAEGNLNISKSKGHRVALQLETTDKREVSLLAEKIGSKLKTRNRQDKRHKTRTYYTVICSKEIGNDLIKLGIIPRKSSIMKFPPVPTSYLKEFVYGYLKGDGCISYRKYKQTRYPIMSFASNSKGFLIKLNNRITNHLKILKGRVHQNSSNKKAFQLVFSTVPTRKIMSWIR